ncbi:MAG: hypothetical protein H6765_00100 [Candidatus Peribacteria bacterium]|nr:MAG: hypothetical protein H6765_00100 [Candidatus Peribacteria bacterium]
MQWSDTIFVMLLTHDFFLSYLPGKEVTDTSKSHEVQNAIQMNSKEDVDEVVEK